MTRAVVAGLDARAGLFPIRLTEGDALPFTIEFTEADGATPTPLAAGTYVLEVRAAPGATLEATVDELATNATKAGPLILELTCDGTADLGYFELPDGTVAARVYIDAGAKPAELEPFLAALGAPFTSCGRTVAPSVPPALADAWGRRYARAARIEE